MKKFQKTFLFFLAICLSILFTTNLYADDITLKSGSVLKGKVVSQEGDVVMLQIGTGTVAVKRSDILEITRTAPEPKSRSKWMMQTEKQERESLIVDSSPAVDINDYSPAQKNEIKNSFEQLTKTVTDTAGAVAQHKPLPIQFKFNQQTKKEDVVRLGIILIAMLIGNVLLSAIILKVAITLVGGSTTFFKALGFEMKWYTKALFFIIGAIAVLFGLDFLIAYLSANVYADPDILKMVNLLAKGIIVVGAPILLFVIFMNMAKETFELGAGQVVSVIFLGLFFKILFGTIIKTGFGPSFDAAIQPYLPVQQAS